MTGFEAAVLPRDIAFLESHGVRWSVLDAAARLAEAWDVSAAETLLSTGAVSPETFYRALAAELDLTFFEAGFCAHPLARYPEAIVSGIAPLAEGHVASYVLAPRAGAITGMLDRRDALVPRLAITTPGALREAVFRARGDAIAREASEQLARERPDHSFYAGLTWPQTFAALVMSLVLSVAAILVGRPAFLAIVLLLGFPFLALAGIKIAAILHTPPAKMPRLEAGPDSALPIYTVLVPLYRERRVLPKLRRALLALDYPAARLDVKVLIEAGDAETADAMADLDWPGFVEIVTVPPGEPRTKPRALNVGLHLARGSYVVVYDAEDVPDPDQLRDAVALFARLGPEVACLQARLVIDNTGDGILPRFFTAEYGSLFDVLNPALAHFDLPVPLGGTSNHLKTEVVRTLGGWDPWNVTEDADLGIRLALAGYRVADLPSVTLEEAPAQFGAWFAQRARWMKGYLQVAITHSRQPRQAFRALGGWRFAGASLLVGGAVGSAAIYPAFTLIMLVQLASGSFFEHDGPLEILVAALSIVLLVAGLIAMVLPALVAIYRRGWWALWPFALAMPLYYMLVSLGAWRGILELVIDPDRWNKTEHGLARTSRSNGNRPDA